MELTWNNSLHCYSQKKKKKTGRMCYFHPKLQGFIWFVARFALALIKFKCGCGSSISKYCSAEEPTDGGATLKAGRCRWVGLRKVSKGNKRGFLRDSRCFSCSVWITGVSSLHTSCVWFGCSAGPLWGWTTPNPSLCCCIPHSFLGKISVGV